LRRLGTHDGWKQAIRDLDDFRLAWNLAEQSLDTWIAPAALGHKHLFDLEMALDGFANQFRTLDPDSALGVGRAISPRRAQLFQSGVSMAVTTAVESKT
jgi:hypothetical protein